MLQFPAAEQNLWVIGSGTETFRTKAEPPIRTVKKVMGKKYFGGGDYDILTFAYNESPGGRRLAVEVRFLCTPAVDWEELWFRKISVLG